MSVVLTALTQPEREKPFVRNEFSVVLDVSVGPKHLGVSPELLVVMY
jgi:hypothetical protein